METPAPSLQILQLGWHQAEGLVGDQRPATLFQGYAKYFTFIASYKNMHSSFAEFPAYDQDLKCLPKFFLKVEAPHKGFWRDILSVWKFLQLLYSGPVLYCFVVVSFADIELSIAN